MKRVLGIAICFVSFVSFAHGDDTDPVLRIRAQRAKTNEPDLPPIPRGLTEPPPLPPPELHTHDIRKARRSHAAVKPKKAALGKKANTAKKPSQSQSKSGPAARPSGVTVARPSNAYKAKAPNLAATPKASNASAAKTSVNGNSVAKASSARAVKKLVPTNKVAKK
ncbi:MAG: hypothetical protein LBQ86_08590 [Holophagales bacterium]|nr:hypothetical protein [Holophagales bacterium]